MKFQFSLFSTFFISFFISSFFYAQDNSTKRVKVLLDQQANFDQQQWNISSNDGFILTDLQTSKKLRCDAKILSIVAHDGFFYLNEKRFLKKGFIVIPKEGLLGFKGNFYKGSFLILFNKQGDAELINIVDLEDYVFAVLRSETWPGWPLEVNKVFAIVTRSYVIAKVQEAFRLAQKRNFHIKSTRIHQTYNGHQFQKRNDTLLQQAVEETKGVFLSYDGKPIVAMFDSCCGGVIPSKMEGVDFEKAPYLARDYACEHCCRCKIYHWQASYSIDDWTRIFRVAFPNIKKVKGIRIERRDDAGLIQELKISDARKSFALSGKKLYSLIDAVKSFCFSIHKQRGNVVLNGRGYGHHLGLCQWGAREMVRDGWKYGKILKFYYPGVLFSRLT